MSEINLPRGVRDALKSIDADVLDRLIAQCLREERSDALRILRLENCGEYVASRLREYERTLREHGQAKAAKKRSETSRAGDELANAVRQMKHRIEREENEEAFFRVEDQIMPPSRLSERISVRVSYRWRRTIEDEWKSGSITFSHVVDSRPDYTKPQPTRKPSAAKVEQERQDRLYREWDYLRQLGLGSVKDYFRAGGDGAAIPETFHAKADSYTRGLNNFSADFWPT